jgi:hypothetical protein
MSVPVYGSSAGSGGDAGGKWTLLCPPGDLTPSKLTSYINRVNTILEQQIQSYETDITVQRLDVIRQEICILTKTPFRVLVQKVSLSNGSK